MPSDLFLILDRVDSDAAGSLFHFAQFSRLAVLVGNLDILTSVDFKVCLRGLFVPSARDSFRSSDHKRRVFWTRMFFWRTLGILEHFEVRETHTALLSFER